MSATVATARPRRARPTTDSALVGTGRLTRLALRRDRVRIPVWALALGGLTAYFLVAIPAVYTDPEAFQTRAAIMKDPSGAFLAGPGYGLDDYTLGAMMANEMLGMLAAAAALMSIFLVVRHTRTEEETGRAELVRAGVVGRRAPLTAALVDVLVANLVVSLTLLAALVANGLEGRDSVALAAAGAMVGLVFGAVAAVTAQLAEHSRAASGMAGATLGLMYVLRGVGDAQQVGGSTLSWLSPIGWAQQTRAFVDLRGWPLLLGAATALVLVVAAYLLAERRDVGAGLLPARAGRADARPSLLSPVGLTTRLERTSILGWVTGLLVFALLTGSMGQSIVGGFADQPQLAEVFGARGSEDVLDATLAAFLSFFAMAVAVYAVVAVNRLNREEDEGRTAAVLATRVQRAAWLGGTLVVTGLGATVLLLVTGLCLGAGAGLSVSQPGLVWDFAVASLAYLPLVLCFMGLALVAHGLRAGTWWVWTVLVLSIVVGLYGPLLDLPQVVLDAAPFGLVPAVPTEGWTLLPLVAMVAVAGALVVLGTAAFRRRDLTA